jgi:hypothetical protein
LIELAPSATETLATGAGGASTTLMLACALTPSLVAVIVAAPGATAEIIPVSLTVAMAEEELCQITGRSVRGSPVASRGVAVARSVCPLRSEDDGKTIETEATGALSTSMTEVPPEEHAVTPKARPVTARMKARIKLRPPL